jgi:hypothetical protein
MTYPSFSAGDILGAADMNAVGLWLVKTQTVGTGVSSVQVTGAFSADYDNYKIQYVGGTQSADASLDLRFGASATGYYGILVYSLVTGSLTSAAMNNATSVNWVGGGVAGQASHAEVDVFGPFLSAYTKARNGAYQNGSNYGITQAEHRVATSYTDFTLFASSGTLTGGTIRVYGYKK